jgi:hypothetical protein
MLISTTPWPKISPCHESSPCGPASTGAGVYAQLGPDFLVFVRLELTLVDVAPDPLEDFYPRP